MQCVKVPLCRTTSLVKCFCVNYENQKRIYIFIVGRYNLCNKPEKMLSRIVGTPKQCMRNQRSEFHGKQPRT